MSASTSSAQLNEKILEAAANARNNPYVQKLIEDEKVRDDAISALKSARRAFDRASSKGWDKELAKDKKLRREVDDALSNFKGARSGLIEAAEDLKKAKKAQKKSGKSVAKAAPKRKSHKLRKLVFIAIVGAIIAVIVNEDARKQLLDALFGAEEEFQYTSTTSTNGTS